MSEEFNPKFSGEMKLEIQCYITYPQIYGMKSKIAKTNVKLVMTKPEGEKHEKIISAFPDWLGRNDFIKEAIYEFLNSYLGNNLQSKLKLVSKGK